MEAFPANNGIIRRYLFDLKNRPIDYLAYGLIMIASPSVYIYGITILLPEVFKNMPFFVQILAYVFATWFLFGILSNLYLIRKRHSSIRGRFLTQPILATTSQESSSYSLQQSQDNLSHRRTPPSDSSKILGQQFMAQPFGSNDAWHICPKCEIYVPNRAWHCSSGCNTCILRRDHHCVFAMKCIGEENHSNFLGLIFYLAIGAFYGTIVFLIYSIHNFEMTLFSCVLRIFVPGVFLIIDFSFHNLMASICGLGTFVATAFFCVYLLQAFAGQTFPDKKHNINRSTSSASKYNYKNLQEFLGPNPIWRILYPFHEMYRADYSCKTRMH